MDTGLISDPLAHKAHNEESWMVNHELHAMVLECCLYSVLKDISLSWRHTLGN